MAKRTRKPKAQTEAPTSESAPIAEPLATLAKELGLKPASEIAPPDKQAALDALVLEPRGKRADHIGEVTEKVAEKPAPDPLPSAEQPPPPQELVEAPANPERSWTRPPPEPGKAEEAREPEQYGALPQPTRRPWSDKLRGEHRYPESGVSFVQTSDFKAAGIQMDDDRRASPEEKEAMRTEAGLKYYPRQQAYLAPGNEDSRKQAAKLAERIDKERRQQGTGR